MKKLEHSEQLRAETKTTRDACQASIRLTEKQVLVTPRDWIESLRLSDSLTSARPAVRGPDRGDAGPLVSSLPEVQDLPLSSFVVESSSTGLVAESSY